MGPHCCQYHGRDDEDDATAAVQQQQQWTPKLADVQRLARVTKGTSWVDLNEKELIAKVFKPVENMTLVSVQIGYHPKRYRQPKKEDKNRPFMPT